MKLRFELLLLTALVLSAGFVLGQDLEENSCLGCHLEQDPPVSTPAEAYGGDVHGQAGLGCEVCHGGDPEAWDVEEAMDPQKGYLGKPQGVQVVELCGKCHSDPGFMRRYNPNLATDQVAKYWTSGHGASLQKGNNAAAQCASCHTVHSMKRVTDPASAVYHANVAQTCGTCHANAGLMREFGLPTDVVDHYKGSVHGVALLERGDTAAPTCNNCHGNHGAIPPEVSSIEEVCGACHVNNQNLFNETKLKAIFMEQGLHGCAVCHTAHDIHKPTDEMIGIGPAGVCGQCHELGDAGDREAQQLTIVLDSLKLGLHEAETALQTAESKGLEVEALLLEMQEAHTALIRSRTMVHTFDAKRVRKESEPGLALAAGIYQSVEALIRDFRMRKIGLGIATILISFLALMLYLYIKSIE